MIYLEVFGAWLFADFLTGMIHYWQDKWMPSESSNPVLDQIIQDNELHHKRPGLMTTYSIRENIANSASVAWPLSALLYTAGSPMILWLGIFFASFGNLIHRWSHIPRSRLNWFILFMQWIGLFTSFKQHKEHHYKGGKILTREESTERYCPMTNYLNPILDSLRFFSFLNSLRSRL